MEGKICHLNTIPVKGGSVVKVKGGYNLHCKGVYCESHGICLWGGPSVRCKHGR